MLNTVMLNRFLMIAAALALVACGGKKDGDGETGQAKGAAKGKPVAGANTPLPKASLEVPETVIAWGGTGAGLDTLLTEAHGIANQVTPGGVPPFGAVAGPALMGELKLTKPDAFDLKKPMRLAFFDAADYRNPMAAIIGIKSKADFMAALPEGHKLDDEGNGVSWLKSPGASTPVYANVLDKPEGYVVITRHAKAFPAHKAFFAALAEAQMKDQLGMTLEVAHLVKRHGAEMDAAFAGLKNEFKNTVPEGQEAQLAIMMTMMDWAVKTARELDRLEGRLVLAKDGVQLATALVPIAGTESEKTFRMLAAPPFGLIDRYPADTPFFGAFKVQPEMYKRLGDFATAMMASMGGDDEGFKKLYAELIQQFSVATDGEMIMAAHSVPGAQGLSFSALMKVINAEKAKGLQKAMGDLYQHPGMNKVMQAAGGKVEYTAEAYKVGDIPVSTYVATMPGLEALGPAAAIMSDLMSTHHAVSRDLWVVAYGSDARPAMDALLNSKLKGGLASAAGPKAAMGSAAKNPFYFVWFAPIDLARRLHLGGQNPAAGLLAGMEGSAGMSWSLGSESGQLTMVIDVPTLLAKQGFEAFQKVKGMF